MNMNAKEKIILVLDDHDSTRIILGNVLKKNSQHRVVTKKDGIEALAWFRTGILPDIILLDMQMPRLNGITFLKNLKSSNFYKNIPVLVLSGNDNPEYLQKCNELGIKGYLKKPFNPTELHQTIDEILTHN